MQSDMRPSGSQKDITYLLSEVDINLHSVSLHSLNTNKQCNTFLSFLTQLKNQ